MTQVDLTTRDDLSGDHRELRAEHESTQVSTGVPRRIRGALSSWPARCFALDLLMLSVALIASLEVTEPLGAHALSAPWLLVLAATTLILIARRGGYAWRMRLDFVEQTRLVLTQSALALAVVLAVWALSGRSTLDVWSVVVVWLLVASCVTVGRLGLHWRELHVRQHSRALRPTLIVGAGHVGAWLARRLLEHPEYGLRPIGFVDDSPRSLNGAAPAVPVLGGLRSLDSLAAEHDVEQILVTFSRVPDERLLGVIDRCGELDIPVSVVPRLFEKRTEGLTFDSLGGLPLIRVRPARPREGYFRLKHALDPVLAAILLVVGSPILLCSAIAVWISAGRPILFRQARVGRDGRLFEMLKFRTMRAPDEDECEALPNLPRGLAPGGVEGARDRRTRTGRFLRGTSLDELPQLINVVRGEMSLVGPRPERPEFVHTFSSTVRGYERRHRVKSGVTGWAQVHGLRGQTSIDDRAEYDNYYIENLSLWLDVKILVLTIFTVGKAFVRVVIPRRLRGSAAVRNEG